MKTQYQQYETARQKIAERDNAFMNMINHPTNPMTNSDLEKLILKRPEIYGKYKNFIGKLKR